MNSNYKLALSIFWIICGAALVWLSIAQVLDASLCSGMGGALIATRRSATSATVSSG